jgi:hypothetical protein
VLGQPLHFTSAILEEEKIRNTRNWKKKSAILEEKKSVILEIEKIRNTWNWKKSAILEE